MNLCLSTYEVRWDFAIGESPCWFPPKEVPSIGKEIALSQRR